MGLSLGSVTDSRPALPVPEKSAPEKPFIVFASRFGRLCVQFCAAPAMLRCTRACSPGGRFHRSSAVRAGLRGVQLRVMQIFRISAYCKRCTTAHRFRFQPNACVRARLPQAFNIARMASVFRALSIHAGHCLGLDKRQAEISHTRFFFFVHGLHAQHFLVNAASLHRGQASPYAQRNSAVDSTTEQTMPKLRD